MIPLKDNIRPRRFPLVNKTLIGINVLVFLYQVLLSSQEVQELVFTFGVVPRQLTTLTPGDLILEGFAPLLPLFTATFLHGGWFHLVGNMLYLWVFGDNIEDCLGPLKYLFVYLIMGIVGHFSHILFDPLSSVPLIGASGAIAGVLGAYLILYPWAKVLTLLPLGIFFTFVEIPAVIFLFLWFFIQVASGVAELVMSPEMQVIAWWAHVGGFISGMILGVYIKRRKLCQ